MAHFHVISGAREAFVYPEIRRIHSADIWDALRKGIQDFWSKPSHYVFLCLIYPIIGLFLMRWTANNNDFPLLYPLVSGFALLGPFAAIGLYEISRRREKGLNTSWRHAFDVRHSPALPAIAALGFMLFVVFVAWLVSAEILFQSLFHDNSLSSLSQLLDELTTGAGWQLIVFGNGIGFLFALVVFSTSVIAFPLLLDRDTGLFVAVFTSVKAVWCNPVPMAFWALIIALLLAVGSLPIFAGLAVVLPILGHTTWHLYRKVVTPI